MTFDEKNWPVEHAFKTVIGEGQFKIAVFVDPECPWCHRFYNETVTKLNDITIYWFLYPVLGEGAFVKSATILSSEDPAKMWREWVQDEKVPAGVIKSDRVKWLEANSRLAEKVGVETVPAVFLKNGEGPFGFMTALELISKIEQYD